MVVVRDDPKPTSINNDKEDDHSFKTLLPQLIAVSVKNVLLFGFGLSIGYPTILIPNIQGGVSGETIVLNQDQISWIGSISYLCVPIGCLLSGFFTQPLGRKRSMQLVNIPFIAAWILFYFSTNEIHLYIALCLTGLGGGLLEAPVITYVAEVTQPYLRGMLSAMSSMTILFAIFIQFLIGTFLDWRTAAIINVTFPVLSILLLFIVPESPYWLVTRKRFDEAQASLAWLRGWTTVDQIQKEYKELYDHVNKNGGETPDQAPTRLDFLKKFMKRSFLVPYFLVSFCFFLSHFSGVTTVQTYAVLVFQTLRTPIDKYYATLVLGVVQLVASSLCVCTIQKAGRRILTFISTIGGGISMAAVAIYSHSVNIEHFVFNNVTTGKNETSIGEVFDGGSDLQWLPMFFVLCGIFFSCGCIRLLPWVLIGEIFPAEIRSLSSGFSAGISYIIGFIANKTFLSMVQNVSLPATFGFYSAILIAGTAVLYKILPETEGRTLTDIEKHFNGAQKLKHSKKKDDTEIGEINHAFSMKATDDNENMESRQ